MKIALVEKHITGKSDPYREYFNFEYDRFELVTSNKSKILKKDITLKENFEAYDFVILIGKEPSKFIGGVSNVTKFAGHLVNEKYIPMLNPVVLKFKPELKSTIDMALTKIHKHIEGSYTEILGDYKGIESASEAKEWIAHALRDTTNKYLTVDIETTSLYPRNGYILGIAMSNKEQSGVYISTECIDETVEEALQNLFIHKICIFHNAKFDKKWLYYHFNFVFPKWEDTMIQHYTLNENEAHDLKSLALKYTKMGEYDHELETFKQNYIRANKLLQSEFSYETIPFNVIYKYAAADADATLRLFNKFNPIIQKHFKDLYYKILLRGTDFLMEIEEEGVPFSIDKLKEANEILTRDIFSTTQTLYNYEEVHKLEQTIQKKFNPNSTQQLRILLFDILNLPSSKKTDKGDKSTDKEVLTELAKQHPIPKIILEIRHKTKLKTTYVDKILAGLDSDSKLRTGFHLTTVTSGRLSSSGKFNMQQIPRDDKTIKNCIVPIIDKVVDDDYVIFSQDLQTAEMYYAAALSGDKNLASVFKEGGDFHSSIAKLTFGLACPVEEVKDKYKDLRQAAKAISFGILYGAGPGKVAETANISYLEAKNIISAYFDKFYTLKGWIDKTQNEINTKGYVYSAFGRKRRVPNVFSIDDYEQGHAMRSAMNFTVQSVASDCNLLAAMDSLVRFNVETKNAKIFALVHDSIVGMCRKEEVELVEQILKEETQTDRGVGIPGCPIKVDFTYGKSYGDT